MAENVVTFPARRRPARKRRGSPAPEFSSTAVDHRGRPLRLTYFDDDGKPIVFDEALAWFLAWLGDQPASLQNYVLAVGKQKLRAQRLRELRG